MPTQRSYTFRLTSSGFQELERDLKNAGSSGEAALARIRQACPLTANALDGARTSVSRFQAANQNAVGGMRNFGVIAQQAGFQIGDFAVQIASGQSAVRAFIQQGAQLLGFFGLWGAIAGATLAVAGAVVTTLLDLESATDKYADAQKTLADSTKEVNDLLQTQEDRARSATNEKQLKALDDLTKAAAQQAVLLADAEAKLRKLEADKAAILERGNEGGAFTEELKRDEEEIAKLKAAIDGARGSMEQAGQASANLFGNIVPKDQQQKLEDLEEQLQLSVKTIGKDNAATLDAKLAAEAAKKGIVDETAAIRGRIVALQADLDTRKQQLDFAADESSQRQKDSDDEVEKLVKRTQAQGDLAFSVNEEIRNNEKLDKALGVSTQAYDEQKAVISELAKFRAAGLTGDEDVAAAERLGKALAASNRQLDEHKAALQEVDDFGERMFDDIGQAATQMSLEGEDAFGSLRDVGKAVANELTLEFVKLAAVNPLKNALFGKNSPTLQTVGGIIGSLFGGSDGGAALAAANASGGGTFGGVGNGPAFRAGGGDVMAGRAYIVGEKRPELFVPDRNGTILPDAGAAMRSQSPQVFIDARGADMGVVARLQQAFAAMNTTFNQRAVGAIVDAKRRGLAPA